MPFPLRDPHDNPLPDGWEIAELVAAGVLDVVPGDPPVPVSVWRATGPHDVPASPGQLFGGVTSRVAAMLLAIYTDPGHLVIDATHDPAVEGAAGARARIYRALDLPPTRQQANDLAGRAGLILLRWPPTTTSASNTSATATSATGTARGASQDAGQTPGGPGTGPALEACAGLLSTGGHTVVILAPPQGGVYRDHAREVIPAAARAGLGYLQHVVVITSEPQPSPSPAPSTARASSTSPTTISAARHLDLLVFILRRGSRP